ncbi:hypothetical protein PYW07_016429 [Mythimna separata]|uniref:Uncharacterized protein n=1 Tax=Mythimna separata TaxID=271217 RepID=A0AAD7YL32_MYTSE|nr:hypothetical protein PYW07_016429 [Mythimna separata]
MSKRRSDLDYEHLTKKIQRYERRLRRLYPPSQSSTTSIAHTVPYEQEEYIGIEAEDWLQDSPEVSPTDPAITMVPVYPTVPVLSAEHTIPLDPVVPSDPALDKPGTSQEVPVDIIDADLDQDTMVILGEDPSSSVKYGPDLHKELSKRLQYIATEGLDKDCRKTAVDKYLVPANCHYIAAPLLNAELKAAIPEVAAKRDKAIVVKQNQMASVISCLGQVITSQLVSKNNELLPKLMDAARILCDIQHYDSVTRRNFILSALKRDMKEALNNTKIDEYLFGENLSDTIKSAKAVTKSGTELKPDNVNKNPPKRPSNPMPQRHLNRRAPAPARRPQGAAPRSREPAATRPPPPPAGSSKRLPPQRQPQRRY